MPGMGGGVLPNMPQPPAAGSLWSFLNGSWQAASLATFLAAAPLVDATTFVVGDLDPTKRLTFQVDTQGSGFTTTIDVGAQTASRTLTLPVLTGNRTLALIDQAQTFTAAQTISSSLTVHGSAITGQIAGEITAQYIAIPDSGLAVGGSNYSRFICYWDGTNFLFSSDFAGTGTARKLTIRSATGSTGILDTTSASSSITGALIIGDQVTAATNVGIGAGNIVAGGVLTLSGSTFYQAVINPGASASAGMRIVSTLTTGSGGIYCENDLGNQVRFQMIGSAAGSHPGQALLVMTGNTTFTATQNGNDIWSYGSAGISTLVNTGFGLTIASTDDSTSTVTGCAKFAGGIGIGKRLTLDGSSGKTLRIANVVANAAVAVSLGSVGPTGSTAGNPQGWMRIDANGTDRYVPFW